MIVWETNALLDDVAKDAIAIGRETGWVWPGLAWFYDDLKKMSMARIMRRNA